jgi:hypothetical protein
MNFHHFLGIQSEWAKREFEMFREWKNANHIQMVVDGV